MGRKRKFGEESDFVSVRVPKSKRKEYRNAIRDFVEKKFASDSTADSEVSKVKINKKDLNGFRKFEKFLKDVKRQDDREEQE
ncbi:MAG: hypothetical protein V3V33_08510 [Candidatus Lokiarchaeia archaeon]